MMTWRHGAIVLAFMCAAAAPLAAADDENKDPTVQYRVNVMRSMGAAASAIGLTIRNDLPQTQNIELHAQVIALNARAALTAFEPKVEDGVAKPVVWEKWQDFTDRLRQLAAAADDVTHVAHDQGPVAAKAKLDVMMPMCKSCHDVYRKK